jgi:hypothetical protein
MNLKQIPLVVTDGFVFYEKVVRRLFGPACLYGRVIKTRRNDRIVKVERRAVLGDGWRLEQALQNSEDSVKLNTSFVEQLNLTIRQGSAYFAAGRSVKLGRNSVSTITWSYFVAKASPSIEIWTGSQNTSAAGWVDQSGIDPKRNFLIEAALCGIEGCHLRAVRNGSVGQFP